MSSQETVEMMRCSALEVASLCRDVDSFTLEDRRGLGEASFQTAMWHLRDARDRYKFLCQQFADEVAEEDAEETRAHTLKETE